MASKLAREYRDRAYNCERIANHAPDAEVRKALLYLARRWREFAEEAEIASHPDDGASPQNLPK